MYVQETKDFALPDFSSVQRKHRSYCSIGKSSLFSISRRSSLDMFRSGTRRRAMCFNRTMTLAVFQNNRHVALVTLMSQMYSTFQNTMSQ